MSIFRENILVFNSNELPNKKKIILIADFSEDTFKNFKKKFGKQAVISIKVDTNITEDRYYEVGTYLEGYDEKLNYIDPYPEAYSLADFRRDEKRIEKQKKVFLKDGDTQKFTEDRLDRQKFFKYIKKIIKTRSIFCEKKYESYKDNIYYVDKDNYYELLSANQIGSDIIWRSKDNKLITLSPEEAGELYQILYKSHQFAIVDMFIYIDAIEKLIFEDNVPYYKIIDKLKRDLNLDLSEEFYIVVK